jgi:DNA repair ATPase RecN
MTQQTQQAPRVATGPALMAKLLEIEAQFTELATEARAHWSKEEQRMQLVDRFVDPSINLDSLLKQVFQTLERNREAMQALEREARRLVGAVELTFSTREIEVNGESTGERMRLRGFEG